MAKLEALFESLGLEFMVMDVYYLKPGKSCNNSNSLLRSDVYRPFHSMMLGREPTKYAVVCRDWPARLEKLGFADMHSQTTALNLFHTPPRLSTLQRHSPLQQNHTHESYSAFCVVPPPQSEVTLDSYADAMRKHVQSLKHPENPHPLTTPTCVTMDAFCFIGILKAAYHTRHQVETGVLREWINRERRVAEVRLKSLGNTRVARLLGCTRETADRFVFPWEKVPDLVATRGCLLKAGLAYVDKSVCLSTSFLNTVLPRDLGKLAHVFEISQLVWKPGHYDRTSLAGLGGVQRLFDAQSNTVSQKTVSGIQAGDPACWKHLEKMRTASHPQGEGTRLRFKQRTLAGRIYRAVGYPSDTQLRDAWAPYFRANYPRTAAVELRSTVGYWRKQRERRVRPPSCMVMAKEGLCPYAAQGIPQFVSACRSSLPGVPGSRNVSPVSALLHSRESAKSKNQV